MRISLSRVHHQALHLHRADRFPHGPTVLPCHLEERGAGHPTLRPQFLEIRQPEEDRPPEELVRVSRGPPEEHGG